MSHSIFLKVAGVEGEENRSSHEGWIKVDYIDYPFQRYLAGFSGANKNNVGDADIGKLSVFAPIDKAMPTLLKKFLNNTSIDKVTVAWCVSGQETGDTMVIELTDARIIGVKFVNNTVGNNSENTSHASQPMSMLYEFVAPKLSVSYTPISLDNKINPPVSVRWNVDTQQED